MAIAKLMLFIITSTILGLRSLVAATPWTSGTATYYNPPYIPSACYNYENKGIYVAGASEAIWNNYAACGRKYFVTCTGPTNACVVGGGVFVTIVDYCTNCQGTINLSKDAFAAIANLGAGKININYLQA